MSSILEIQNIGKRYIIGGEKESYLSLREQITKRFRSGFSGPKESFWALKDVSFDVAFGETVGIIGKNGAGKSTLLKILSRITPPTKGRILSRGRVASLLEVGTGFHPELSGRENVYLNGSILGLSKQDIDRKFDEIVDFSGVSKFLETPLKRYSSGMQLRLAFAVAAHLEPEILVIDEVLAVGDAEFQKKCLGKMDEVSKSGRTVLFVSHNMEAVKRLCTKGVLLVKGECKCIGDIDDVMERYLEQYRPESQQAFYDFPALGPDEFGPKRIEILVDGQPSTIMNMGDKLSFAIDYQSPNPVQNIVVGLLISSDKGEKLINANNVYQPYEGLGIPSKSGRVQCELGQVPLMPGQYAATFWIGPTKQDKRAYEEVINFEVLPHDLWGTGKIPPRNASNFWWNTQFSFQQTTEPSV